MNESTTLPASTDDQASKDLTEQALKAGVHKKYDFQAIQASIQYHVPGELPYGSSFQRSFLAKDLFLKTSGIPCTGRDRLLMSEKLTWQEADKLYQSYLNRQASHKWLPIFRQAASAYILINTALLADASVEGKTKTAFYYQEYMEANRWEDPGLGYFGLRSLKNFWSQEKCRQTAEKIIDSYSKSPLRDKLSQMKHKGQQWQTPKNAFAIRKFNEAFDRKEIYLNRLKAEFGTETYD